MEYGQWYRYAAERLALNAKQYENGQLIIGVGEARRVLAMCLKIESSMQTTVISELVAAGYVEYYHKQNLLVNIEKVI